MLGTLDSYHWSAKTLFAVKANAATRAKTKNKLNNFVSIFLNLFV
jgi:hypothetical protein